MSNAMRAAKMETGKAVKGETSREATEVAEAIKALQMQLADLRKIVQAARTSEETPPASRRRQ